MKNIDKTRIDENIVIRTKQRKFFCIIDGTKMFGHVVTKRFFCQFSCASKFEVLVLEKWSYLELCGIESADKMNSTNKEKPKKVKSVKMSVDFSSMDIEDRIMGSPSISISSPPKDNPPFSLDDDDYINEQYFVESTQNEVNSNLECAFSEVDPKLILAASKFVHELIFQAQIEAQNRLMSSQLDNNIADTDVSRDSTLNWFNFWPWARKFGLNYHKISIIIFSSFQPLLAGKGQKRPKLGKSCSFKVLLHEIGFWEPVWRVVEGRLIHLDKRNSHLTQTPPILNIRHDEQRKE